MRTRSAHILCATVLASCVALAGEAEFAAPTSLEAHDTPNDAGGCLCVTWPRSASESGEWDYVVLAARQADGPWRPIQRFPSTARLKSDMPDVYGFADANTQWHATQVRRPEVFEPDGLKALRARERQTAGEHAALSDYERAQRAVQRIEDERDTERQSQLRQTCEQAQQRYRTAAGREVGAVENIVAELGRLDAVRRDVAKEIEVLARRHDTVPCHFRLAAARRGSEAPAQPFPGLHAWAGARPNLFNRADANTFVALIGISAVILGSIAMARRREFYLRKIAGLDAVDEALGRCTEMGKPALFVHGLTGVSDTAVIASVNILGRMARRVAEYDTPLLVVNNEPVVYSLSSEVVREGFVEAGRPDRFREDHIFMVASRQFPYVAAVAGIMARERPAANFFMGYFYAESLILAEAGAATGAIQIAGTDAFTQLPFFVTTCDYTLMGEELYAASAYLSREPKLMGTLRGQDIGKAFLMAVLVAGTIAVSLGSPWLANLLRTF